MTDPSEPLFLFGPGYSARALATMWQGPVFGTFRDPDKRDLLHNADIQPISIEDQAAMTDALGDAQVLISAPPGDDGCPALAAIGETAHRAKRVTYLSTTGVYGDLKGGWAVASTTPNPSSLRARRRAAAEQAWKIIRPDLNIVRLPGIYGPGRSAFDRLRQGTARRIFKTGQVFSRIHVDDLAYGLSALLNSSACGVFNLCDDEPAPPQDVIAYAATLRGVAPPPLVQIDDADLSEMARSFYSENKRVSNARIKAATGWRPIYPSYREGLAAILKAGA